jgi:hypothetical protein
MLLVIRQQRLREIEYRDHPLVPDPVGHCALLTSRLDEPAPAQAGKMIRVLRLRHTEACDEFVKTVSSSSSRNSSRIRSRIGSPSPRKYFATRSVGRGEVGGRNGAALTTPTATHLSEVSDVLAGQGGASCWRRKPPDLVAAAAR